MGRKPVKSVFVESNFLTAQFAPQYLGIVQAIFETAADGVQVSLSWREGREREYLGTTVVSNGKARRFASGNKSDRDAYLPGNLWKLIVQMAALLEP